MAMNHNVRLSLIFTFIAGTSRGVWSFSVLSGYLYVLTNSNFMVGLAEGIQGRVCTKQLLTCRIIPLFSNPHTTPYTTSGSTQVLVAIPSGIFLTDGIGRDATLKIGGVVAMVTIAFTLLSLLVLVLYVVKLFYSTSACLPTSSSIANTPRNLLAIDDPPLAKRAAIHHDMW
eukprot:jgi/Bigna1/77302/fgenesh1_pg.47_\